MNGTKRIFVGASFFVALVLTASMSLVAQHDQSVDAIGSPATKNLVSRGQTAFLVGAQPPHPNRADVTITITVVPCGGGGGVAPCCAQDNFAVKANQTVKWIFPDGSTGVEVDFPNVNTSPFVNSARFASAGVYAMSTNAKSNVPKGTVYPYSDLTWNNGSSSCKNVLGGGIGTLGIIMM